MKRSNLGRVHIELKTFNIVQKIVVLTQCARTYLNKMSYNPSQGLPQGERGHPEGKNAMN